MARCSEALMRGTDTTSYEHHERAATGVAGLDHVLQGGFPAGRMYLIEGAPGAGKTTLALQFLLEGARHGERGVYVTLSETEGELRAVAASHGWDLGAITVCDLQTQEQNLQAESQYTLFHPAEVELSETTKVVLQVVERVRPKRVIFDSLSEMRLLARDSLRYRRQILALKHYFSSRGCTVLLLDTRSDSTDFQLSSMAHGVVILEMIPTHFGVQRRRLRVAKIRGLSYTEGYHDYGIHTGGLRVFPRLVASEHEGKSSRGQVSSGVEALDSLVGGGLERGTSTLLLGPAGAGKSTIAMQYVRAAADRGERAAVYIFDEHRDAWLDRSRGLQLDLEREPRQALIDLQQVNPAQLSPGAFSHHVRKAVEEDGAKVLVIDSLNGFLAAMPDEGFLSLHLHELFAYLTQKGVLTVLCMAQHGLVGGAVTSPLEISYIADTVLLLRYFEAFGEVRKAISVVKKRIGPHEHKIRELRIGAPAGIQLGEELRQFEGVLTGAPVYKGSQPELFELT